MLRAVHILRSGRAAASLLLSRAPFICRALSTRADAGSTAAPPTSSERVAGAPTKHTFQAETKQLLNIVANSLYTDKHVFIR
jgi:hypothetical protein